MNSKGEFILIDHVIAGFITIMIIIGISKYGGIRGCFNGVCQNGVKPILEEMWNGSECSKNRDSKKNPGIPKGERN